MNVNSHMYRMYTLKMISLLPSSLAHSRSTGQTGTERKVSDSLVRFYKSKSSRYFFNTEPHIVHSNLLMGFDM